MLAAGGTQKQRRLCIALEPGAEFLGNLPGTSIALTFRMPGLPNADITAAVIGAFFDLWKELGHGFSEHVYRRALCILLRERGLIAVEEQHVFVDYHGHRIGTFRVDISVWNTTGGRVLVEVKAGGDIDGRDDAQILNYLKCAGGGVGILLSFGRDPKHKRFVMGDPAANLPNLAPPPGCMDPG